MTLVASDLADFVLDEGDTYLVGPNLRVVLSDDIVGNYVLVDHLSVGEVDGEAVIIIHSGEDLPR